MTTQEEIQSRVSTFGGRVSITMLSEISNIPIHEILREIPKMKGSIIFSKGKVIALHAVNNEDLANALIETERRIQQLKEYKKYLSM